MLNYIWAGLIIISLVFALTADVRDLTRDTYRNDQPLPVTVELPEDYDPTARRQPVVLRIDPATSTGPTPYRTRPMPRPSSAAPRASRSASRPTPPSRSRWGRSVTSLTPATTSSRGRSA
jgi:hypothetical protein